MMTMATNMIMNNCPLVEKHREVQKVVKISKIEEVKPREVVLRSI